MNHILFTQLKLRCLFICECHFVTIINQSSPKNRTWFFLENMRLEVFVTSHGSVIAWRQRIIGTLIIRRKLVQLNPVYLKFSIRAGINYDIKDWVFSAGMRDGGAPVYELFGKSDGIRRSGYTIISRTRHNYKFKSVTIHSYVTFLTFTRSETSALDKIITKETGVYTAARGSGDYQIFCRIPASTLIFYDKILKL